MASPAIEVRPRKDAATSRTARQPPLIDCGDASLESRPHFGHISMPVAGVSRGDVLKDRTSDSFTALPVRRRLLPTFLGQRYLQNFGSTSCELPVTQLRPAARHLRCRPRPSRRWRSRLPRSGSRGRIRLAGSWAPMIECTRTDDQGRLIDLSIATVSQIRHRLLHHIRKRYPVAVP